jgi:hypothetical protein
MMAHIPQKIVAGLINPHKALIKDTNLILMVIRVSESLAIGIPLGLQEIENTTMWAFLIQLKKPIKQGKLCYRSLKKKEQVSDGRRYRNKTTTD